MQLDKTVSENKFILPYPDEDPQFNKIDLKNFNKAIYSSNKPFPEQPALLGSDFVMRYSRIIPLNISPFQYNPVSHQLIAYKKLVVLINYNSKSSDRLAANDNFTDKYLKTSVINYSQALQWTGKEPSYIIYGGRIRKLLVRS